MESSGITERVFCLLKRVRGPTQGVSPRGGGIDIIFYVNFATISVINFVKNNFFRYFFKLCPYFIDKELSRVLQLYTELINKYGIR